MTIHLILITATHVAVYAGRQQIAVFETPEPLKPEEIEQLRLAELTPMEKTP